MTASVLVLVWKKTKNKNPPSEDITSAEDKSLFVAVVEINMASCIQSKRDENESSHLKPAMFCFADAGQHICTGLLPHVPLAALNHPLPR